MATAVGINAIEGTSQTITVTDSEVINLIDLYSDDVMGQTDAVHFSVISGSMVLYSYDNSDPTAPDGGHPIPSNLGERVLRINTNIRRCRLIAASGNARLRITMGTLGRAF